MGSTKASLELGILKRILVFGLVMGSWEAFGQKHCPPAQKPHADSRGQVGYAVFQQNCEACHGVKEATTGPSMLECARIYKGNKAALVQWLVNPGRKRRRGPQMPPQTHLNARQLSDVADWILTLK